MVVASAAAAASAAELATMPTRLLDAAAPCLLSSPLTSDRPHQFPATAAPPEVFADAVDGRRPCGAPDALPFVPVSGGPSRSVLVENGGHPSICVMWSHELA